MDFTNTLTSAHYARAGEGVFSHEAIRNMNARTQTLCRLATCALSVGLVIVAAFGCGDDTGYGKRYKVSGRVTYKGEPVKQGNINFSPVDAQGGHAAEGKIIDGNYQLTTAIEGDGALPGDYRVTIRAREEADMSKAKANTEKLGGSLRQDDVAKAISASKSIIPVKYELPETANLTKKVEPRDQTIDFPLED